MRMRAQCDPFELEFTDNNRPFLGVGSFLMQEIQVYKKTLLALYLPAAPSSIPAGCQQQQRLLSLSDAASLTELEGSVERGRLFDCRWEQSRTVEDDSIHTHTSMLPLLLWSAQRFYWIKGKGGWGRKDECTGHTWIYAYILYSFILQMIFKKPCSQFIQVN